MAPLWIIKLGGSLGGAGTLDRWCAVLTASPARLVVVPGGGPFADAVRAAQAPLGYSDRAAHHMALLAMEQFGVVISERLADAPITRDPVAVARALERSGRAVWAGTELLLDDPSIARDWSVTSDSVAAWLAIRLGAPALALVKSVRATTLDPAGLAAAGVVDPMFPRHFSPRASRLLVVGPGEEAVLAEALREDCRDTP